MVPSLRDVIVTLYGPVYDSLNRVPAIINHNNDWVEATSNDGAEFLQALVKTPHVDSMFRTCTVI
jgi:hypothetical protein